MANSTLNDVAKLAGVSAKTVSRVVNQEPYVRQSIRDSVNSAIKELDYRPNQTARRLAGQRSFLIGLVYDDPSAYEIPSSGYVINMQQGALRACRAASYDLLIHPCNYREKRVGAELKSLIDHARPDGIIVAAPLSGMPRLIRSIQKTGTPIARISPGEIDGKSPQCVIATNDREISAEMTRYLASLGHERIAFITGHSSHTAVTNRFLGYQDGLRMCGLKFSARLVVAGDNSIGSGEAGAKRLLSRKTLPTAIFAANDDMAAGVIRVADRLGINIPQQLSIAGFDDIALARQIYPSLTTIRQPLEEMTERAASLLIAGAKAASVSPGTEIIPATIQIRESTGPAPA